MVAESTPRLMRRYVDWQLRTLGAMPLGDDDDQSSVQSSAASVAAASGRGSVGSSQAGGTDAGASVVSGVTTDSDDSSGSDSDSSDAEWLEVRLRVCVCLFVAPFRVPTCDGGTGDRPSIRPQVLVPARDRRIQLDSPRGPGQ